MSRQTSEDTTTASKIRGLLFATVSVDYAARGKTHAVRANIIPRPPAGLWAFQVRLSPGHTRT